MSALPERDQNGHDDIARDLLGQMGSGFLSDLDELDPEGEWRQPVRHLRLPIRSWRMFAEIETPEGTRLGRQMQLLKDPGISTVQLLLGTEEAGTVDVQKSVLIAPQQGEKEVDDDVLEMAIAEHNQEALIDGSNLEVVGILIAEQTPRGREEVAALLDQISSLRFVMVGSVKSYTESRHGLNLVRYESYTPGENGQLVKIPRVTRY